MEEHLNSLTISGKVTRRATVRTVKTGKPYASFAISSNFRIKFGASEELSFYELIIWGDRALSMADGLEEGVTVLVEGHLKQDRWLDKSGTKQTAIQIIVDKIWNMGLVPEQHDPEQGPPPGYIGGKRDE